MKSRYAGKRIQVKIKGNPRREHSLGWHNFRRYRNGMTYEAWRASVDTYDLRHLYWDIAHNYITLE